MPIRMKPADARALGLVAPRKRRERSKVQKMAPSVFEALCVAQGLMEPVAELCFAPPRKWKFDWAWPEGGKTNRSPVALEIDGGAWTQGRHTRGQGFIDDMEKMNAGVLLGWRIFHCAPADVASGLIFDTLRKAMT